MLAEPLAVAARIGGTFDALGVPWLIAGSVASSLHGIPRATQDIDLVADLGLTHADPFARSLADDFYVDVDLIREAIRRRGAFNVIHLATMTKIDVFVLKRDPFSLNEMRRRTLYAVGAGSDIGLPIASPEDIILQKLDWYRRGGQVSERQWRDVLGVVQVTGSALDLGYLREQAGAWGLSALLEEALSAR